MNWNAALTLLIAPLNMAAVSLTENPLAAFILKITHNNWEVGLATGVGGMATLFVGPAAGWLADRIGRDSVLRIASVITCMGTCWMCLWLLYFQRRVAEGALFQMLLASQLITGIRRGIQQPALDAIFGDSVASGQRSQIYAWRSSLRKIGLAVGPAVAAVVFLCTGDEWTEAGLTAVLLVGAIWRLVPAALLWLFRDTRSLGAPSEALHIASQEDWVQPEGSVQGEALHGEPQGAAVHGGWAQWHGVERWQQASQQQLEPAQEQQQDAAAQQQEPDAAAQLQQLTAQSVEEIAPGGGALDADPSHSSEAKKPPAARGSWLGPQHVAPMVAIADLVAKLGSGMSVRFFPLYFWKGLGLQPAPVCLVLVAAQLGGAIWTLVAQKASLVLGRIQVVLLFKSIGIGMLIVMALFPGQSAYAIIPLYLLRTWLMNAPLALSKSVLNDYVPKRHRAKWNSLESVNTSTWAGSAVFGGFLADRWTACRLPPLPACLPDDPSSGYRHVFLLTAALQTAGLLLYVPLAAVVALERGPPTPSAPSESHSCQRGEERPPSAERAPVAAPRTPSLATPLLSTEVRCEGPTESKPAAREL